MRWLAIGTAVLAVCAFSSLAVADEKDAPKEKGGALRQKLLEKYDTNGNGKIDPDEMEKARADRGKPDAKGGNPGGEGLRDRMLKMFDKDGDGKLSDDEKAAAKEAMKNRAGGAGGRPNMEELIKRFDKDGDGKLSDAEKAAAREAIKGRAKKGKKPE